MTTPFDVRQAPCLPSALGLIRVSAAALRKYHEETFRITHHRQGHSDERMYDRIADHLRTGQVMIRKNASSQMVKHGQIANYMVDSLWVMVVSRDNHLLDIYRKDHQSDITEMYQPFHK